MTHLFRALFIGDLHVKQSNVNDLSVLFTNILNSAEETKPDIIIQLGDVLDSHEKINLSLQKFATEFLLNLSRISPTYILIGNHDRPNNSEYLTENHPFYAISKINEPVYKNNGEREVRKYDITIIDKPRMIKIENQWIVLCPYVPNGRFDESLSTIKSLDVMKNMKKIRLFVAHQEFKGCKMGSMVSSKGDKWPEDRPLVISGHIHQHHQPQKNIFYAGTPYQLNYDDVGDKGIFIFDFYDTKYESMRLDMHIKKKDTLIVKDDSDELPDLERENTTKFIIKENIATKEWISNAKKLGHKVVIKKESANLDKMELKSYKDMVRDILKDDEMALGIFDVIANK